MWEYIISGVIVLVITIVGILLSKNLTVETSFEEANQHKLDVQQPQKPDPPAPSKVKNKKSKPAKTKPVKEEGSVSLASNLVMEALSNYNKNPTQENTVLEISDKQESTLEAKPQTERQNKQGGQKKTKKEVKSHTKMEKLVLSQAVATDAPIKLEEIKKKKEGKNKQKAGKIEVTEVNSTTTVIQKNLSNGPLPAQSCTESEVPSLKKAHDKKKVVQDVDPTADMLEEQQEVRKEIIKEKKKPQHDSKVKSSAKGTTLKDLTVALRKTDLTNSEIQVLVEALLNKQQHLEESFGEWVEAGKVDPTAAMKKQLAESQQSLSELKDTNAALMAKIMSLRSDLNSERLKANTIKKQMEHVDLEVKKKLEAAALYNNEQINMKIKEVSSSLEQEYQSSLMQEKKKIEAEYELAKNNFSMVQTELENQLQQLQLSRGELENQLKQTVHQYDQRSSTVDAAYAESENQKQVLIKSRDELAKTCQQYQQHLNTLKEQSAQNESSLSRQIHELQANLQASENARTQALTQYSQVTGDREQLLQEMKEVDNIKELYTQGQAKIKSLQLLTTKLESKVKQCETESSKFEDEAKQHVARISNLETETNRLTSLLSEQAATAKHNGETETLLNGNSAQEISALTEEINSLKKKLETRQNKNDEDKRKYGEDRDKAVSLIVQLIPELKGKHQNSHSAFLEEAQKAIPKVQQPTQKAEDDSKLAQELKELKLKYNELEKKVGTLTSVKSDLEKQVSSKSNQDKKIQELTQENRNLSIKVDNYKEVLSNTESLLKSLQVSVEGEEALWKDKISESETTIAQLKADKTNLTQKLSALESSLDQKVTSLQENLLQEKQMKEQIEEKLQNALSQVPSSCIQVSSTNGVENAEGKAQVTDSTSVVSSSSVSEERGSSAGSPPNTTAANKKKKRKSFLSKLIR